MSHASQGHEEHAGLGTSELPESHHCLGEGHPLRLPRRQRPSEAKRKLYAVYVVLALSASHDGQNGDPRPALWFHEKAWPLVLREVHEHVRGLSTHDVVVVGVVAWVEHDLHDFALASVYQAVLDSQVVQ